MTCSGLTGLLGNNHNSQSQDEPARGDENDIPTGPDLAQKLSNLSLPQQGKLGQILRAEEQHIGRKKRKLGESALKAQLRMAVSDT
eukprot:g66424.t1